MFQEGESRSKGPVVWSKDTKEAGKRGSLGGPLSPPEAQDLCLGNLRVLAAETDGACCVSV